MTGGWLNFDLPRPDWLNFGRTATPANELSIAGSLPALSGSFVGYSGITLRRDSAVAWTDAQRLAVESGVPWRAGQCQQATIKAAWASGQRTAGESTTPWTAGSWQWRATGVPWDCTASGLITTALPWRSGDRAITTASVAWRAGSRQSLATALGWAAGLRWATQQTLPWQSGQRIQGSLTLAWRIPIVARRITWLRWDQARRPRNRWRIAPYIRPPSTKREGRLNFVCPWPHQLNFGLGCLGSALLYPKILRSYRVLNSASLVRLSDSADIPCSAIRITLDWVSWCWSLSATLIGRAAHELVPAYPGKVRATLNGFAWDFLVDDLRYSRSFSDFSATLTGRSPAAVMASPYAATRSYTEANLATAQQLALQELGEGWTLDWAAALLDWTVPAGTYQYQNLTPMESIIRIVKATGGRVYADATDTLLHVAPKWPVAPWRWGTAVPDQSLPSSYTLTEQRTLATGAEYDCIVVSGGVNNGVFVLATRAGMPGTYPADAVVDSLITDLAPATARAIQEIADQWPMKQYSLSLPLQAPPTGAGLLLPGTIFDFVDGEDGWRGLVTGVTLTAGRNSIMQDLEVIAP